MVLGDNLAQSLGCDRQRWFLRLLTLVVLMAVGADAWGQKTSPRPGEEDPLGNPSRYTLFPDQELLAVLAHDPATAGLNPEFSFNTFAPSADLKTLTPLGGTTNLAMDLSAPHMGAAAGRILASDRDQIVYARRTGSSLAVAFLGYSNSTTTLSPLANQLPDSADVFDIAVGDLDKVADLDGNNHDEVIVCFATAPNYGEQVVNVSRLSTFYVELKDSKGTTFASTKTDTTDWSIGGSLAQTATVTAQEGIETELTNVGAKQTFDFALTVGYDYEGHEESYNSQYATRTLTFTDQTIADDLLVAEIQTFDIWRYRAFGISLPDGQNPPLNGFYEIVLPGPKTVVRGGGTSFDWYQPLHENGNILSYPVLRSNTFTPSDLGSFTLPDGTKKNEPLLPATLLAFDGTSGTIQLDFSQSSGAGSIRSAAHTLAENVDTSLAAEATAIVAGSGGSTSISTALNFHNSNSLSNITTSDSETNTSSGITLVKAAGTANRAYNFAPVFYFAKDGTVKVVHAVDVLGNAAGRSFWASTYGQKPDPALNLPLRFERSLDPFTEVWIPNTLSSRKKIRGFFLREAVLNTVTNDYDYLAKAPVEGDEVRLETRIYNYSTAQAANNVKVRFQVIGYNDASDTEIPFTSCPTGTLLNNGRCTIGETFVSLDPLAMRPVAITWDTSGFGPTSLGGAKEYRVYVVLDPDNTIDEIYEGDNSPGQNNEGFGTITIAHAPLPQGANKPPRADARLRKGAIAAIDAKRGTLFTDAVDAYLNRPLRIRVHVTADVSDRQHYHLLVYKGVAHARTAHHSG
jgi:hypothetical protein